MTTHPLQILIECLRPGSDGAVLRDANPRTRQAVLELAVQERLSPALGALAINQGWTGEPPPAFAQFLRTRPITDPWQRLAVSYVSNRARMADLADQYAAVSAALDAEGIEWAPLKGAALLEAGVWPDPATRTMTDLDVLVWDPAEASQAQAVLEELGYRAAYDDQYRHEDRHQLSAVVLPGRAGSVEVHRGLMPAALGDLLSLDAVSARAQAGRLLPADLIRHIVVHARLVDQDLIRLRGSLRSVLDVGYLLAADPAVADGLTDGCHPALRRALLVQLGLVGRVFDLDFDSPLASAWWQAANRLSAHPRLAWWWDRAARVPRFFGRRQMEVRFGRELRGGSLVAAYPRAAWMRLRREFGAKGD